MSFFKKLVDKVEDFLDDKDKKEEKKEEKPAEQQQPPQQPPQNGGAPPPGHDQSQNRDFNQQSPPPPQQQPSYGQYPTQGQYPPQQQQWSPQPQGGYHPPPQGPPAPYGAPPPMPPGWHAQWDQGQNRWYYVEQATGRTQWDPPAVVGNHPPQGPYAPPPGVPPSQAPYSTLDRGQNDSYYGGGQSSMPPPPQGGGYGQPAPHGYGQPGQGGYGDAGASGSELKDKEKKDKGGAGMMVAAGVGGVALGALAGGIIAHEMTEDDNKQQAAAQPVYVASADNTSYVPAGSYAPVPPHEHPAYADELPDETRSGSSVSSSDKESLEERREELEEMRKEYEEAQRDYEEAYEETYD